jgi:hypothetical protein
MTRAARFVYTIAILIGLLLGSFWGFRETTVRLGAVRSAQEYIVQRELEDFSGLQYKNADPDHARAALLMYVNFFEQLEKANPGTISKLTLSTAFMRLALLEEKAHNAEQSQGYMGQATSWCKSDHGGECTESQIRRVADALDRHLSTCEP